MYTICVTFSLSWVLKKRIIKGFEWINYCIVITMKKNSWSWKVSTNDFLFVQKTIWGLIVGSIRMITFFSEYTPAGVPTDQIVVAVKSTAMWSHIGTDCMLFCMIMPWSHRASLLIMPRSHRAASHLLLLLLATYVWQTQSFCMYATLGHVCTIVAKINFWLQIDLKIYLTNWNYNNERKQI